VVIALIIRVENGPVNEPGDALVRLFHIGEKKVPSINILQPVWGKDPASFTHLRLRRTIGIILKYGSISHET
jgi:hypothetical protein